MPLGVGRVLMAAERQMHPQAMLVPLLIAAVPGDQLEITRLVDAAVRQHNKVVHKAVAADTGLVVEHIHIDHESKLAARVAKTADGWPVVVQCDMCDGAVAPPPAGTVDHAQLRVEIKDCKLS